MTDMDSNYKESLSIVVPCFNEEGALRTLEKRIRTAMVKHNLNYELIFIDDASNDTSNEILRDLVLSNPSVKLIENPTNGGIFYCWTLGVASAKYDYVCLIDCDLQNPPEDIPRMYNAMRNSNYSVVQGVRSDFELKKGLRFFYSRTLNLILNILFHDFAKDNKSGFIVARADILENALSRIKNGNFRYPQTFIRIALIRENISILETETLFMPRKSGESFLKGWSSIKAIFAIFGHDLPLSVKHFRRSNYSKRPTLIPGEFLSKNKSDRIDLPIYRRLLLELYFVTMPLHKWIIRRNSRSYYFQLLESQYFTREQIEKLQLQRLKNLLDQTYRNVPFYRKRFQEINFHPSGINSLNDLGRLQLLSKEDVRQNLYFDLFSEKSKKGKLLKVSTSGSTGQPFVVYADKFQLEVRFATTLRQLGWTGWRFGDRQLRLWHQRIGMTKVQVFKEHLDAIFMRRKFIPAFEISETNVNKFIKTIEDSKPVLMDGYAESLNFLANYLKDRHLKTKPGAVMSSAQILPAQSREIIESTLGTKVFDKYGSREFSGIAYECEHGNGVHHVMDESYIVEILVDGRKALPGEIGEVLITDLNNFSVPLIRYRIGDLAECVSQDACKCGRNLSKIGKIQGRTQAIVYCSGGVWMPGTFFAHFFKDYDSIISQFQIYQETRGMFTLRFIRGVDFTENAMVAMMASLRKYVGETKIDLMEVKEIPLLITGKRSPVVSMINEDFQSI